MADYNNLKNGGEGDYRIKVAHTYLDSQSEPCVAANADTGYCGNVILPDGTAVICSYGIFSVEEKRTVFTLPIRAEKAQNVYYFKRINVKDVENYSADKNSRMLNRSLQITNFDFRRN